VKSIPLFDPVPYFVVIFKVKGKICVSMRYERLISMLKIAISTIDMC